MARNQKIRIQHYLSPCGELVLGSLGDKLCLCNWVKEKHPGRVDQRLQTGLKAGYEEGASDVVQEAIGQLEGFLSDENVGKFVAAGQTAMLVSTHKNAEIISHFMAVFLDYVRDREQGKVTQARVDEFVQARKMLEFFLREEMYRYDTMKRPLDKHLGYHKDQQSDKHYADD